jgi:DNA polymerase-3 subunit gamma/tau
MPTLYRDYRPQNFSETLGQNHIKITLQSEISSARPASAYLFCGPRAVGKTTLARVVAKAVNCETRKDGESEPCNKCASCLSITAGKNLDIIEIDAASNTGVDNVRENIIAFSRLVPTNTKFKVFIIDEVHMLSLSAFNALLKIIEEPPTYVIFILCTTEIQKVPNTIISRCERFDFKRISVREIIKKLSYIATSEKMSIDSEVLEAIARRSGGHLRDAESLLGQIFSLGDKRITGEQAELVIPHYNSNEAVDLLDYLSRKDAAKAVALVNSLTDSGVNLKVFTGEIIDLLREMMLDKLSPELADNLGLDLGENLEKRLGQVAANLSWEQLLSFTRYFLEVSNNNKSPMIPQLPLELAIVELCFGSLKVDITPAVAGQASLNSHPSPGFNLPKNNLSSKPLKKDKEPAPEETAVAKVCLSPKRNSAGNQTVINLSAAEIMAKWPEFLVKVKKYNHSLSFVFQNCLPQEVINNKLCLVFKYKFHQDRIKDVNIKSILESTLEEVFGATLTVDSVIDENLKLKTSDQGPETPAETAEIVAPEISQKTTEPSTNQPVGLIEGLLKTFGGEVIN